MNGSPTVWLHLLMDSFVNEKQTHGIVDWGLMVWHGGEKDIAILCAIANMLMGI
jgi:hypothetical protein